MQNASQRIFTYHLLASSFSPPTPPPLPPRSPSGGGTVARNDDENVDDDDDGITLGKALDLLRPFLPASLPLYRRLQFGRFSDGAGLVSNLRNLCLRIGEEDDGAEREREREWVLALVDRSWRPETEVWCFGSWEVGVRGGGTGDEDGDGGDSIENGGLLGKGDGENQERQQKKMRREMHRDELMKSLLRAIRDMGPIPESIHQTGRAQHKPHEDVPDSSGVTRKQYTLHLTSPHLILFGATHSSTTHILNRNGLIKTVFDAHFVPNWTYIFDLDDPRLVDVEMKGLPEGLRWGELDARHWELVKSRTQIPRQDKTLSILPNIGIFPVIPAAAPAAPAAAAAEVDPIAWVFVGLDGSLTTLHVEEAFRGKGLGKLIAVKLWRDKMPRRFFGDGEKRWGHDYVISGNVASSRVSEGLGGTYIGDTFWVRVDLKAVGDD